MSKYCSVCGAKLKDEDLFCPECGSKTFDNNKIKNSSSIKNLPEAKNELNSKTHNTFKIKENYHEGIQKQPNKLSAEPINVSEKPGSRSSNKIVFYSIGGFIVILFLFILAYFIFQENDINEANKLLSENKPEEAITILSQIEKDDKLYSEAQYLLKYVRSKIVYDKALNSYNNNDFSSALNFFNQVEVPDSFPSLSSFKEEANSGVQLIRNLPGTYEGSNTPNLGGAYMIINTKMQIDDDLIYSIKEQMTDTYNGGFYNNVYAGKIKPRVTRFNSGDYGFILDLEPFTAEYKENDFSVYFYKFKKYWRLQFNLEFTWGSSTQEYTLNLFREANQEDVLGNDIIQNPSESFSDESVKNFIKSFLQNANTKNIDALLDSYSNDVDYFGKGIVDKNFIRKDKEDYFKKWDDVIYKLEDNSLSITELPDNSKQAVFNIEYSVYSSERNKQLRGIAQSAIKIRQGENGFEIYDEKQKIISKN